MGVVKYTGPMASFHCPTNAEIRSLKVHFSPKQEGSGDPSPENVRPISGWTGVEAYKRGKNIWNEEWENGVYATSTGNPVDITEYLTRIRSKSTSYIPCSPYTEYYFNTNGHTMEVYQYRSDKSYISKFNAKDAKFRVDAECRYLRFNMASTYGNTYKKDISVNYPATATSYEPYQGETIPVTFPVLGKNKFNWNVEESISTPIGSDPSNARSFIPDTYVIGMSCNNYYRQNYSSWVLNPSVSNGIISFSSSAASGYGIAFPLKLAAGQSYFLSGTGNGYAGATYYDKDGNMISYKIDRLNKTITVPSNTIITLIGFYASAANSDFTFSNIQLELGSEATAYEPYDPNNTVYGGYVDLAAGEVVAEWKYTTINENYYTYISGDSYRGTNCTNVWFDMGSNKWDYNMSYVVNNINDDVTKCESFKLISVAIWSNPDLYPWHYVLNNINQVHCVFDNTTVGITSEDTNAEAITKIKAWVHDHPIKIAYRLAKAKQVSYPLTPTQIQTLIGQNNVWSNADYVEVEYDLHETQTILARKQYIMANQPHIVKPAAAPLQSFVTDLAAPLKECKVHFEPKQDLHGYNNPWIGGAGKNLFDYSNATAQYVNGANSFSTSDANNLLSPWISVTPSTAYTYSYKPAFDSTTPSGYEGLWTGIGFYNDMSTSTAVASRTVVTAASTTNVQTITFNTPADCNYIRIGSRHLSVSGAWVQLEKGSTATSYEPYENICPIENWTGCNITGAGKNLLDSAAFATYAASKGATVDSTNKTVMYNGGQANSIGVIFDKFESGEYTVIVKGASNFESAPNLNMRFNYTDNSYDGFYLSSANETSGNIYKFKSKSNKTVKNVACIWMSGTATVYYDHFGIFKGDVSIADYQSYTGTTLPVSWQPIGTNLYSGNDISGTQYVETTVNAIPAGTYTFSAVVTTADTDATSSLVYFYDSSDNIIGFASMLRSQNGNRTMANVTLSDTCTKIGFYAADEWSSGAGDSFKYSDIRLNEDTIETARFPSTIYGGYVDLVNGELVAEFAGKIYDGSSDEFWTLSGNDTYVLKEDNVKNDIRNLRPLCDKFLMEQTYGTSFSIRPVGNNAYASSVAEWREWLALNPIQVVYQLQTPIHYPLTTQTLKTLRGQNNIWSTTNGNIELSYWTH